MAELFSFTDPEELWDDVDMDHLNTAAKMVDAQQRGSPLDSSFVSAGGDPGYANAQWDGKEDDGEMGDRSLIVARTPNDDFQDHAVIDAAPEEGVAAAAAVAARPEEYEFWKHLDLLHQGTESDDMADGNADADSETRPDLLELLVRFAASCERRRGALQEHCESRAAAAAVRYGVEAAKQLVAGTTAEVAALQLERDTWSLLGALVQSGLGFGAAAPPPTTPPPPLDPAAADAAVVGALFDADGELRTLDCICSWLESTAPVPGSIDGGDIGNGAATVWVTTLKRLRRERAQWDQVGRGDDDDVGGSGGGDDDGGGGVDGRRRVLSLHPDATLEQRRGGSGLGGGSKGGGSGLGGGSKGGGSGSTGSSGRVTVISLDGDDDYTELAALEGVWGLLRAGHVENAVQFCATHGQEWRAASLSGGLMLTRAEDGNGNGCKGGGGRRLVMRRASARPPASNAGRLGAADPLWVELCCRFGRALRDDGGGGTRIIPAGCMTGGGGGGAGGAGGNGGGGGAGITVSGRMAVLERAIHAVLGRDPETALALPLLHCWEDRLWLSCRLAAEFRVAAAVRDHRCRQKRESSLFPAIDRLPLLEKLLQRTAATNRSPTAILEPLLVAAQAIISAPAPPAAAAAAAGAGRGRDDGSGGGGLAPSTADRAAAVYRSVQTAAVLGGRRLCEVASAVLPPVFCVADDGVGEGGGVVIVPPPYLLRFVAHVAIVLRATRPELTAQKEGEGDYNACVVKRAYEDLVAAYAAHLAGLYGTPTCGGSGGADGGDNDGGVQPYLVARYAAMLPRRRRVDLYSRMMARVQNKADRIVCTEQAMERFDADFFDMAKKVVRDALATPDRAAIAADNDDDMGQVFGLGGSTVSVSDLTRMAALQWLYLRDETYGEAVVQAAALVRCLMLSPVPATAGTGGNSGTASGSSGSGGGGGGSSCGQPSAGTADDLLKSRRVAAAEAMLSDDSLWPGNLEEATEARAAAALEAAKATAQPSAPWALTAPAAVLAAAEELRCWREFFVARRAFGDWRVALERCRPRQLRPPPLLTPQDHMRWSQMVEQHCRDTAAKTAEMMAATTTAAQAIKAVLTRGDGALCRGRWMRCELPEPWADGFAGDGGGGGGDDEDAERLSERRALALEEAAVRVGELDVLRRRWLPGLVFLLHQVYSGTGDWCLAFGSQTDRDTAARWFAACQEVPTIVADEDLGLAEIMTREQGRIFFGHIHESQMKLLHCEQSPRQPGVRRPRS